ncbi:nucleotide exchange factor GrpE [Oceanihabitans sediminis]|uniref:nucleotide exchange factor GrpE n=1 Tax=Oceanihabitans sediminis TaxID=1812012 RepID=UPI003A94854B
MSKKDNKEQVVDEQQEQATQEQEAVETQEISVEEKLQEEVKQEKEKFLRLFAEFENYKKRTTRERIDLFKTASEDVMLSLLPIIDDFERAISHIEVDKKAEELSKGVNLIYQKLLSTLEKKGLSLVEVAQGDLFDADHHEAITQIPSPSEDLKGKVVDVIEKGYKLGDKIIRFPKVVIGQ